MQFTTDTAKAAQKRFFGELSPEMKIDTDRDT